MINNRSADVPQPMGAAADLRLPRPPGVFRRFWARHPRVVDGLLAGFYALPTLIFTLVIGVGGFVGPDGLGMPSPGWYAYHLLVAGVLTAAIYLRRRFPFTGIVIAWIAILIPVRGYEVFDILAVFILLYSLPLFRPVYLAWIGYGGLVVANFVSGWMGPADPLNPSNALSAAFVFVIVVLIGINIGNRRRYVAAIIDRAAQLARERDQQAQIAAIEERARIAREMHDIVAHSLSVMIALADGAAAAVSKNTEAAQKAMESSAETGRGALAEMRRLLGVLSTDGDETVESMERVPMPGAENIVALVETFRSAGLVVRYSVEGVPTGDKGQQLTVYRVAQESLTNALRYAGVGATVDLAVQFGSESTRVVVIDDGRGTRVSGNEGSGRGLAGIRQRLAIFGGSVDAAAYGRGWRLDAVIPLTAAIPSKENES